MTDKTREIYLLAMDVSGATESRGVGLHTFSTERVVGALKARGERATKKGVKRHLRRLREEKLIQPRSSQNFGWFFTYKGLKPLKMADILSNH